MSELLGKNNKSNNVNELLVDGTSVSDPKSIADAFNEYFIGIGSRLAAEYVDESCSNVDNQPINYNINQSSDTFFKLSPISVDSVASTLRGLKACKATGLDKIPAKILKLSANIIAPSLTFIFNLSLATGVYSQFKKGCPLQTLNFKP